MTGVDKERKNRDPIFTVCLVVFMLAAVGILGVFVNEHYLEKDDTTASMGDKVEVNYTGSLYDFVDGDNAVVFDTSYKSVADNDSIIKSNDFAKESGFGAISFTIGDGKMLEAFENAVIGHKVGDKIKVEIDDGYPLTSDAVTQNINGNTMSATESMSKTDFENIYPDCKLENNGAKVTIKSIYGWDAVVSLETSNTVVISYVPQAGETYDFVGVEDRDFGKVQFKVTSVDSTGIHFDYVFSDTKTVSGDQIQMIKMDLGTEVRYITDVGADTFTYQNSELGGQKLYFEIELVSIN